MKKQKEDKIFRQAGRRSARKLSLEAYFAFIVSNFTSGASFEELQKLKAQASREAKAAYRAFA